jgi:hypothetical protein
MSEAGQEKIETKDILIPEDQLSEVVKASPEHPFSRMVGKIREKGKDVYTDTVHYGIHAGVMGKSLLTLSAKFGVLDMETHNSLLKTFEPLQHVTNMGASYAIIGTSVATAEFAKGVLEAADQPKAAKIANRALPIIGAVSAVGVQLLVESRKIVPWDTLDPKDALYGIAMIAPGYFAARHFLSKNYHLREKGIALFGRLTKKVENPSEVVLPSELAVSEVREVQDNFRSSRK